LSKRIASGKPPGRIDGLMVASLTYVLWFGLFPVFRLAG
jgi:1,4-dihydroxy-2-naphthoate polyprenyltransferase